MGLNVYFVQLGYWRTETTSFSSAISVFGCGFICKLYGKTVMTWWRLHAMLERISTNLSLGRRWFSLPGGIFGRSGMTELSGTSSHLSERGEMDSFMISLCSLIESNRSTERSYLNGLISYLLEGSCFCSVFVYLYLLGLVHLYSLL